MSADSIVPPHEKQNMEKVSKLFRPPTPQQAPWLVFFAHGNRGKTISFYSIVERRSYVRSIAEMHRKFCEMYSHGWLLMSDWATNSYSLLNPKTMETIPLPPIQLDKELPNPIKGSKVPGSSYTTPMLSEPSEDNCVVLFAGCYKSDIMFCYLRENEWRKMQYMLEDDDAGLWNSITCRGKLYGLTFDGRLAVVDFDPNPVVRTVGLERPGSHLSSHRSILKLVESCGELFLVEKNYIGCTKHVLLFRVYKADFAEKKWMGVHSIGDRAFFLCSGSSVSCPASESGIEGDSIYYVEHEDPRLYRYDMTDRSIIMDMPCPNMGTPWSGPHWIFL